MDTIPPNIARTITSLAHHHNWPVGMTKVRTLSQGWSCIGITSMSIYMSKTSIIALQAHDTMLVLTCNCDVISIDMRLGAYDFVNALSQALSDFTRNTGKVTYRIGIRVV